MVVVLSLVAALAYGLSDFVGGLTSRRAGPWVIAFASQLGGVLVTLVALVVSGSESPTAADLGWGVLAGVGSGLGTAFLYRGLSGGRMGVVAPVSGVGAAVLPVVVGVVTGERPSLLTWAGVVVALPAIWLVASQDAESRPDTEPSSGRSSDADALTSGVLAGLGFGTLFAALGQLSDSAGPFPFTINQVVGSVVIALVALALHQSWVPRTASAAWGLVPGLLGVTATLLFAAATRSGLLAVAAVITSLYPAGTVLLAATTLGERVGRRQGAGLALCGLCVVLTALP